MAIPSFRAATGKTAAAQDATPALPSGVQANDILILIATVPNANTASITANGSVSSWNAISGSPVGVASGEKLYVWWGRYSSGSTGPTVHASASDVICADIVAYSGCIDQGSPIDNQTTGTETTSDTSFSFATGISSTRNNCLAICVASILRDSNTASVPVMTNASLASLASRSNVCTNTGSGGGFGLSEGTKATAGTLGTWACTYAASSPKSYVTFALIGGITGAVALSGTGDLSGTGTRVRLGAADLSGAGSMTVAGVRTQRPWLTANFEKGTNGATIGTGDAGDATAWDNVQINAGSTLVYDNTKSVHGTQSAKIQLAGNNATARWISAFGTQVDHYGRIYVYLTANPAAEIQLVRPQSVSTGAGWISITTAGKVGAIDSTGSGTLSTNAIALNQWVRIEYRFFHNASTGVVEAKLFNSPDSTTATETVTKSSANTLSSVDRIFFGDFQPATVGPFWFDHVAALAQSYPGPVNSADLSGTGSLTVAGTHIAVGATALAGTGSLTADGNVEAGAITGAATLIGTGALSATGAHTAFAAATITGAGTLSGSGTRTRFGAAAVTGTGSMTVAGVRATFGAAALTGTGSLSEAGVVTRFGAAALTGTGSLAVSGVRVRFGVASLSGSGTLTATGGLLISGAATITGTGTLTVAGVRGVVGVAPLTGVGTLAASGSHTAFGAADLAGFGTQTIDGTVTSQTFTVPTGHILQLTPGGIGRSHAAHPIRSRQTSRISRPLAGSKH